MPVIGCDCPVCRSHEPRNERSRSSVLVRHGETALLVDSGPDLRMQALREGLRAIDAVLYTHGHLDHVAGFDELRAFCWRKTEPLPLHATEECMETLRKMYGWAFFPERMTEGYIRPDARIIVGPFSYGDLTITPLSVEHASVETIGYLFEAPAARRVAYLPDVKRIPELTMELIKGVDVLIVDALRHTSHPTHMNFTEALAFRKLVEPRTTWFTHIACEILHARDEPTLPPDVRIAYDGLKLEWE